MIGCIYCTVLFAITIIGALMYFANRFYFCGDFCKSKNRLDGKVSIITGSNTGIGYETALDFARRGARVIMACRDTKKAEKAAKAIIDETNNKQIEVEYLDLADLDSVRSFGKLMLSKLDRLDLLVNNAGIMACPLWRTKQSFEMQFGVNHLGHFLLTNILLDLLKKSGPSRIINVSSLAHIGGGINWDDINSEKSYNTVKAYSQSKTANILFTVELARRLQGTQVTSFSLHPGSVRTELLRYTDQSLFRYVSSLINIFYPFYWVITKSSFEGAQTTIHCSVSDEVLKHNGSYFSDCKPTKAKKWATNEENAKRLWDLSLNMVNLP